MPKIVVTIAAVGWMLCGCAANQVGAVQVGKATWYGGKFHGRKTASGEIYDKTKLTAAHKKLPFGTRVRITNQHNGKTVTVRITDRGPFGGGGRVIDLSEAAAEAIGMRQRGVAKVTIEILSKPESR